MVNQQKWADFVKTGTVSKPSKQHKQWNEDYAQFSCPYVCGKVIELPEKAVAKSKSTECRTHLMKCNGVDCTGRKAIDDSRVAEVRGAEVADGGSEVVQKAKRARGGP